MTAIKIYLIISTLLSAYMFNAWSKKSWLDTSMKFVWLLLTIFGIYLITKQFGL